MHIDTQEGSEVERCVRNGWGRERGGENEIERESLRGRGTEREEIISNLFIP